MKLSAAALRVLGCLIEKDQTTPEYYPLSLNGLVAACNQRTNRDPVVNFDDATVTRALEELRGLGLALQSASGRVLKYSHNMHGKLHIDAAEAAVLAELFVRGPQTAGELRARADRMHRFADLAELEASLLRLMENEPPLVARLPLPPGRKEVRYAQVLGPTAASRAEGAPGGGPSGDHAEPHAPVATASDERVARLEAEMAELRAEVAALWREFRSLTMQPEPDDPTDPVAG